MNNQTLSLPGFVKIKQNRKGPVIKGISTKVKEELDRSNIGGIIKRNDRVGIALGSRGISGLTEVAVSLISVLKKIGARPFIVPAMGCHGYGTAFGQKDILEGYGISEKELGVDIEADFAVIKIGESPGGIPVYFSKVAAECDAIIPINRIKQHTDFSWKTESGLLKMLAIGLGKWKGAMAIHRLGVKGLEEITEIAKIILNTMPVKLGIGIVENSEHEAGIIQAIRGSMIIGEEIKLLKKAMQYVAKLPFSKCDLLIINRIGKDISGTGMDTKVVGRIGIMGVADSTNPTVNRIFLRDLTDESHGNAIGVGLADFITRKLYEKIDLKTMYSNAVTSTFVQRVKIPMIMESDFEALKMACRSCWKDPSDMKIAWIKSTSELSELTVSENLLEQIDPNTKILGELFDISFDQSGNIRDV